MSQVLSKFSEIIEFKCIKLLLKQSVIIINGKTLIRIFLTEFFLKWKIHFQSNQITSFSFGIWFKNYFLEHFFTFCAVKDWTLIIWILWYLSIWMKRLNITFFPNCFLYTIHYLECSIQIYGEGWNVQMYYFEIQGFHHKFLQYRSFIFFIKKMKHLL